MTTRILRKLSHSSDRQINLSGRDCIFFGQPVGEHGSPIVKEIQNPVIHMSEPDPQLVNVVPQIVGVGATQFVALLGETLNFCDALISGSDRNLPGTVKPIEKRA